MSPKRLFFPELRNYFPQKHQLILELIIILTAATLIYEFSFVSMNY